MWTVSIGRTPQLRAPMAMRLRADVRHGHAHSQREYQRADDQYLAMLVLGRIINVSVNRMVVHRQQAEEIVVALENRL